MKGYRDEAPPAQTAPLLLRPEEAARRLSISRCKFYALLAAGEVESFKIGGLRRIPASALDDYITRMRSAAGAA